MSSKLEENQEQQQCNEANLNTAPTIEDVDLQANVVSQKGDDDDNGGSRMEKVAQDTNKGNNNDNETENGNSNKNNDDTEVILSINVDFAAGETSGTTSGSTSARRYNTRSAMKPAANGEEQTLAPAPTPIPAINAENPRNVEEASTSNSDVRQIPPKSMLKKEHAGDSNVVSKRNIRQRYSRRGRPSVAVAQHQNKNETHNMADESAQTRKNDASLAVNAPLPLQQQRGKREHSPLPTTSSLTQSVEEFSIGGVPPPKRARLDVQAFFAAMSSPLIALRTCFSKETLLSATTVDFKVAVTSPRNEAEAAFKDARNGSSSGRSSRVCSDLDNEAVGGTQLNVEPTKEPATENAEELSKQSPDECTAITAFENSESKLEITKSAICALM